MSQFLSGKLSHENPIGYKLFCFIIDSISEKISIALIFLKRIPIFTLFLKIVKYLPQKMFQR